MDADRDREEFRRLTPVQWASIPLREHVLDSLCHLLLDTDELLGMLAAQEASSEQWLLPYLRKVYDDVDLLMRKMSD